MLLQYARNRFRITAVFALTLSFASAGKLLQFIVVRFAIVSGEHTYTTLLKV